ncbi:hypothetical protein LUZ60_014849 [Juncus effusus]|nr:hypothetical protein LUZ60_014846 [Juncus effusus]KAJ3682276.1 hypothetical protein LUZ60_014849 [Juncus effusus]
MTSALCDLAFDTFVEFNQTDNPFPSPSSSAPSTSTTTNSNNQFEGMRGSFLELKQQLDLHLYKVRRKRCLLRRTTHGSGICLIGCTTGITIVGLVLATHAMTVMLAGSAFVLGSCGLFAIPRLKDDMDRLDAAARNTYVLSNDLCTIEKLVERLHATIESDRKLVKLGLEEGKGRRHPIEHVVQHLRNNYASLVRQLSDLDEHICLYFASVNRARSVLLDHVS